MGADPKPHTGGNATQDPPAATGDKPKRRSPNRTPEGHQRVNFLLPNDEHAQLKAHGDDDDRDPNTMARTLIRRHLRQAAEAKAKATNAPT